MDPIINYFKEINLRLSKLQNDLENMIKEKESGKNDKNDENKDRIKKSIIPLTKLYKTKEEAKKAKENPEMDYIQRVLEEIFK